jgi:hypothetical protein
MNARISPEQPENSRPIPFGASSQPLRTLHSAPVRAAGAEIRPSENHTSASGALGDLRPSNPSKPDTAEPHPPRSGRLDSPAKRSYRFHPTPATTATECGLIQPAICGVKSDTRQRRGRREMQASTHMRARCRGASSKCAFRAPRGRRVRQHSDRDPARPRRRVPQRPTPIRRCSRSRARGGPVT